MKINNLLEAISLKHAKKYTSAWPKKIQQKYEKIFSQFPNKDKKGYRIYFPFAKETNTTTTKIPDQITDYLDTKGYDIDNYEAGLAKEKKNPNRKIKIGKILSDNPELTKIYTSDPSRITSKKSNLYIVISRHPIDIAGMSTGRRWTSCMNLTDGGNKKYILADVKNGTLVAYVIKEQDKNIQHPLARILIKPYVLDSIGATANDVILYPEQKIYGTNIAGFRDFIVSWCDKINGGRATGLYCLKKNLYNDSEDTIFHNLSSASEAVQLETVKQNGRAIQFIKNPSEEVQLAAVKQNGRAIEYIDNSSEAVQLAAVKQDKFAIKFIKNPSEAVQLEVVKQDGWAIRFINNPSEAVQLEAVKQDGLALKYIKNPSEEVQLAAVKQNGRAIEYIDNSSEAVQLAAVKQNGWAAIQFIKNPSEAVQLAAVKQDGRAIGHIKNPSEAVQLAAVKQDWWAIQFIKNPSEAVQLEAVKQDGRAIRFINNPSEAVQLAVKNT